MKCNEIHITNNNFWFLVGTLDLFSFIVTCLVYQVDVSVFNFDEFSEAQVDIAEKTDDKQVEINVHLLLAIAQASL
jgi:hypothetical protein